MLEGLMRRELDGLFRMYQGSKFDFRRGRRLALNQSNWVETVRGFGRLLKQAAGRSSLLVDAAARCSRR
jgi:hypothetical protein